MLAIAERTAIAIARSGAVIFHEVELRMLFSSSATKHAAVGNKHAAKRRQHWNPDRYEAADDWRREHRRLWQHEAAWRLRLMLRRREIYRLAARQLCREAAVILLDQFDIAKAARLDADNPLHAAARRNRVIAAVSSLTREIAHQAAKAGVKVIDDLKGGERCSSCRREFKPLDQTIRVNKSGSAAALPLRPTTHATWCSCPTGHQ